MRTSARVLVLAALGTLVGACTSAPGDTEATSKSPSEIRGAQHASLEPPWSGPSTCGSGTEDVQLMSFDDSDGTIDVLLPPGNAYGLYKHQSFTQHLPSRIIPGNPVKPMCAGLAKSWDAHVSHQGGSLEKRNVEVLLANLARAGCLAAIASDCTSGDVLSIQPLVVAQ